MNDSLLSAAQAIFEHLILLDEDQRDAQARSRCGDNLALLDLVNRLLQADHAADTFDGEPLNWSSYLMMDSELDDSADIQMLNQSLGDYRVLKAIGEGGMGRVYLAERKTDSFDQRVAIKILRIGLSNAVAMDRFIQERQILAQLAHPGITRLIDGGTLTDGRPYLVMDYTPGLPITHHCRQSELSLEARLNLFLALCDAVIHAHQNLVIHRDIKPANVLVTDQDKVCLLDFGIAKLIEQQGNNDTRTGSFVLTPDYASPEQVSGKRVTIASDIYSLGVLLYEMLCEFRPFSSADLSPAEFERLIHESSPTLPSAVLRRQADDGIDKSDAPRLVSPITSKQLQGDLDNIVMKALQSESALRYQSVVEFRDDIHRYLKGLPVLAHPPGRLYRASKFLSRHALASSLVLSLFVMITAIAIYSALLSRTLSHQTIQLTEQRDKAILEQERSEALSRFMTEAFTESDPTITGKEIVTEEVILAKMADRLNETNFPDPDLRAKLILTLYEIYLNRGDAFVANILIDRVKLASVSPRNHILLLQAQSRMHTFDPISPVDFQQATSLLEQARTLANHHPEALSDFERLKLEIDSNRRTYLGEDSERISKRLGELMGQIVIYRHPEYYLEVCRSYADLLLYSEDPDTRFDTNHTRAIEQLQECLNVFETLPHEGNLSWQVMATKSRIAQYSSSTGDHGSTLTNQRQTRDEASEFLGDSAATMSSQFLIGHTLFRQEDFDQALEHYLVALDYFEDKWADELHETVQYHHRVALTYQQLQDFEQAVHHMQIALQRAPNPESRLQIDAAKLYFQLDQPQEALPLINNVLESYEQSPYMSASRLATYRTDMAILMYEEGIIDQARALLEEAVPVMQVELIEQHESRKRGEALLKRLSE